jgi:hypothetical protein
VFPTPEFNKAQSNALRGVEASPALDTKKYLSGISINIVAHYLF